MASSILSKDRRFRVKRVQEKLLITYLKFVVGMISSSDDALYESHLLTSNLGGWAT